MGTSARSDIVKFCIHNIYVTNCISYDKELELCICSPEAIINGEANYQTGDDFPLKELIYNGWKHIGCDNLGKKKRLFGDGWQKDNHIVYLVNECQYSAGGSAAMAIASNTKESIIQFMNDWKLKMKSLVEEDESIMQFG